ncbi:BgTH12-02796 [Blumeria graminis f. sp. triticale]|uniref:cystathionine gamma-synthase n=1 Tax=Blumeria graminis f. sp. triticale TaxID=1689686 RepID=A0A9W4D3B6_BLUGR|nr:BgTH12-02796 [Blumeria graminis f. sp. triticale]
MELGESIPPATLHAVSVSLPTWQDNIDYEEGRARVIDKLSTGYPRSITAFSKELLERYGKSYHSHALLLPSSRAAKRCMEFLQSAKSMILPDHFQQLDFVLDHSKTNLEALKRLSPSISAVFFPAEAFTTAKKYWQHTGEGVSSRKVEFCHKLFTEGILVEQGEDSISNLMGTRGVCTGPRRYQKGVRENSGVKTFSKQEFSRDESNEIAPVIGSEAQEESQFLEERFGRNLDVSFADIAKSAIRRRIAGLSLDKNESSGTRELNICRNGSRDATLTENDVYLWPCGMNSIFNTHKMLMEARGTMKSIYLGFPYVDTLKILEKFGPGCLFYGYGSLEEFDDLEERLKAGEKYLALFCEFPGNPLLTAPDLLRIRKLADTYDFAVVIDETIGNYTNVDVLPYVDVVVSSLSKIFSGECNVLGGASLLNPNGRYYHNLKKIAENGEYEDNYWPEDAIFMERNSRDFVVRSRKINENAEAICKILLESPIIKDVHYPKYNTSKNHYDACRRPTGGYGGLISFVFHRKEQAIAFYDRIEAAKGPSLGTNFTLVSPYVLLAHYFELDWAAQFGVPEDLIRISVGLEDLADLLPKFESALQAAGKIAI